MKLQDRIEAALKAAFTPGYLLVENESHLHHRGEDSHFKVIVVSQLFDGLTAVKRHQQVYGCLGELMDKFHALALHTYTPIEWESKQGQIADSPRCLGGSLHDL